MNYSTSEKKDRQLANSRLIIDRWSVGFISYIVSLILFFVIIRWGSLQYVTLPMWVPLIYIGYISWSSPRILRNEYDGIIYIKKEKHCGLKLGTDSKKIEGLMIPNVSQPPIFKLENGTDIIIDSEGKVLPAGFGSKFINCWNDASGYRNVPPNDCWEIK